MHTNIWVRIFSIAGARCVIDAFESDWYDL